MLDISYLSLDSLLSKWLIAGVLHPFLASLNDIDNKTDDDHSSSPSSDNESERKHEDVDGH